MMMEKWVYCPSLHHLLNGPLAAADSRLIYWKLTVCGPACVRSSAMNWNKGGPGVKRGFGFGGFSLAGKKEEPQLPQKSHTSFGGTGSAGGYGKNQQLPSFYKIGTKRANFDEENAYAAVFPSQPQELH